MPVYAIKVSVTSSIYDGRLKKTSYRKQLADHLIETEHVLAREEVEDPVSLEVATEL